MYWFAGVTPKKDHRLAGQRTEVYFLMVLEAGSKVKMSAIFSLCLHMVIPTCVSVSVSLLIIRFPNDLIST